MNNATDAEKLQLGVEKLQRTEIELDAREVGDERHDAPYAR